MVATVMSIATLFAQTTVESSSNGVYLFGSLFGIIIGGIVGYLIGNAKGRGGLGAVLGALLGCIGWIIIAVIPRKNPY